MHMEYLPKREPDLSEKGVGKALLTHFLRQPKANPSLPTPRPSFRDFSGSEVVQLAVKRPRTYAAGQPAGEKTTPNLLRKLSRFSA